jgi:hypothetical protein
MNTPEQLTAALKVSSASIPESSPASAVTHSPLFKLPRELRDYIYEYAFCNGRHRLLVTKVGGIPEPALLLTCKIIRDEAVMLFYGRRRLKLIINSYDPAVMKLWLLKHQRLSRAYNLDPAIPSFRHIGPRNWDNLMTFLQLRHSNQLGSLYCDPPGSPRYNDERFFVMGLFKAVMEMQNRS